MAVNQPQCHQHEYGAGVATECPYAATAQEIDAGGSKGSRHGGERGVTPQQGNNDEEQEAQQSERPVYGKQYAQCAGYAFATSEAEKDGIEVSEKGSKTGEGDVNGGYAPAGSEVLKYEEGSKSFERIKQEREQCSGFAAGAHNVVGTGVAAAVTPGVRQAQQPADGYGEVDGAEQVGGCKKEQSVKVLQVVLHELA